MSLLNISSEHLKQYIQRIERLEEDKRAISEDLKEVYAEAKSNGFDVAILKHLIKIRNSDPKKLAEQEQLIAIYKAELGML